jgi:hypothetical protein
MPMQQMDIAKVCHESFRAWQNSNLMPLDPAWEDAPDTLKADVVARVQAIQNNIITKPEDAHTAWLNKMLAGGWTWGQVHDDTKKTDPMVLDWDKLSYIVKARDYLFLGVAKACLSIA